MVGSSGMLKPPHVFRVRKRRDMLTVTIRRWPGFLRMLPVILSFLALVFVVLFIYGVKLPFVDNLLSPLRSSLEAGFIWIDLAWGVGTILYSVTVLRPYGIRERLLINCEGIRLHRAFRIISHAEFYTAEKVVDLRLVSAEDSEDGKSQILETGMNALVIDYAMELVPCGEGLTDEQAKEIRAEIKNHFPQYVK